MEEGVATETRRGGANGPGVTGIGWTLPCSLSSLLAMNCRARAEELARRLQSRVKVTNGGSSLAFEQTSLVSPPSESPYASMECRHSSLDDPTFEGFEEHNLRPIHVVTSEPTLHLRLPTPPPLNNVPEQDSDVYYDFDLASPDEVVDDEEEEEDEEEDKTLEDKHVPFVNGERPESGCVTSVTSPLMFDDVGDEDDDGDNSRSGDLYPPQESVMCSPDADLRAVRQILSSSSIAENQYQPGDSVYASAPSERFSSDDDKNKISEDDKLCNHDESIGQCDSCLSAVHRESDSVSAEGVSDGVVDKCLCRLGQVGMPVANSRSCWCHTARGGTQSAYSHLPTSPDRHSFSVAPSYSDYSEGVLGDIKVGRSYTDECDVPVMTDDEESEKNKKKGQRSRVWGEEEEKEGRREGKVTEIASSPVCSEEELEVDLSLDSTKSQPEGEEEEVSVSLQISDVKVVSSGPPQSISGTTPPLSEEVHLYVPSEGQPAVMEARAGSEGDLHGKDEVCGADFDDDDDDEVIETLVDDDEESDPGEENEEDVEEEVILTGKFRNIRGYRERVRRLSDEVEDRPPPPVVIHTEEIDISEPEELIKSVDLADEGDQLSSSDLASQLSQLDVEDVSIEVQEPEEIEVEEEDIIPAEGRSSSEETDPERIEDFKMRIKRSSSLKCGKTPPGTPGRKKIVRFADVLGLDLAAVRTFLAGVPHVPRSAFWDLDVEKEAAIALSTSRNVPPPVPRRVLTPLFQQPGFQTGFMERVRLQKVVVDNVVIGEDLSVRGTVRVLSMDFHKSVYVRYTFDQWRNFHEAIATYIPGSHDGATDRFSFLLWGSFLQDNGTLVFCIRYNTLGQEFWDNNFGRNYSLQCYSSSGMAGNAQNTCNVQQQYMGHGGQGISGSHPYTNFDSPVTPNDPWATRFF